MHLFEAEDCFALPVAMASYGFVLPLTVVSLDMETILWGIKTSS